MHDRVLLRLVASPAALPMRDGRPDHRPFFVAGTVKAYCLSPVERLVTCDDGTTRSVHIEDLSPETPGTSTGARRAA